MEKILIIFLASILIWLMYIGLVFLWVVDGRVRKETALHAFISSVIAWIFSQMIKTLIPTPRPFVLNGRITETLTVFRDGAFPSGHAALAFALATTIWLHNKKLGILYLIGALVIGAARVLGNVHYPIDIVGGAVIGIVIAFVIEKLHLKT
ncbi:hypothetical protein A3D00_03705 [Candidatus Woesebacteria bacterium RIFCSPHIGHO2_02_FULL_38_9]|uniref:Phosphatidic acid phosphatase type 2/haloperoxidase domain-containing protein n=1 Tax=Candidatus Woesebacteria bacterium RIFCSPHIGHO2_01_FULL_39_28 TaxID=1802496 RepID=A0A1F7YI75_9BACT|nr:MAG: hypothetical protein A2627_01025 [Candidatus Woesebacteria bacterium RIFCSPHIGHO2_01_FULL_39_28]OGM32596.1 MAG: hypothetical protein A3D00_03705 [Candidatus Woesebacteria bacterium RIFCSPHIGHO2_02_FULL_38_9]OGM57712.1 MAG: hypothetical protein A3A50_01745 [Candidatus Woesebacteria bacterium RIFCSPLOWO2_01_FULL_38_20]